MANTKILFCCVLAMVLAIVASQGYLDRPGGGGRPMRCPNGRPGYRLCNGFDPSSCPPGQFCYAPADAGVCCRSSTTGGGTCPPPSRRACFGISRHSRRCWSDRQCRFGQRCCFDGCQKTCQDTLLTIG